MSDLLAGEYLTDHVPVLCRHRREIPKTYTRVGMSGLPAGEPLTSHVLVQYMQKGDAKT
jgi:hypothetical protein